MSIRPFLLLPLLLAGCYDQPFSENFGATTPGIERRPSGNLGTSETATSVRIGDQGPNFPACSAQGRIQARDGLPVRAAPFDRARQTGTIPFDATVFICGRSMDQHWMGIVYEAPGRASEACGVTAPSPSRRDYPGPCASGWVSSAQVRTISGIERASPATNGAAPVNAASAE